MLQSLQKLLAVIYDVPVEHDVADFLLTDRSRLPEPYRFSFRVTGPRILSGVRVSGAGSVQFLTPTPGSSWC